MTVGAEEVMLTVVFQPLNLMVATFALALIRLGIVASRQIFDHPPQSVAGRPTVGNPSQLAQNVKEDGAKTGWSRKRSLDIGKACPTGKAAQSSAGS